MQPTRRYYLHSEIEDNCTKLRHFNLLRARMKNEIIFTEPSRSVLHLPPNSSGGPKPIRALRDGAQFRAYQLGGIVLCMQMRFGGMTGS